MSRLIGFKEKMENEFIKDEYRKLRNIDDYFRLATNKKQNEKNYIGE